MTDVLPRVVSAAGLACVLVVHRTHYALASTDVQRRKVLASTLRTVGAVLFPAALLAAVDRADHSSPALLVPLAWVFGAWALDSHLVHHGTPVAPHRMASLRIDPTSVTALSFGLCSLVGARSDSRHVHLVLYAVVGCAIGVMPSHTLHPDSLEAGIFESVQKAILMWCIGFLLAGVGLARTVAVEEKTTTTTTTTQQV